MINISPDNVAERLMRYVQIDTQSDPTSNTHPTTEKQKDLSKLLYKELRGMGLTDVETDAYGYVYATIPANTDKKDIPAVVKSIEYDPNRTAFIALLNYVDGEKRYIIAPNGLQVGTTVISGDNVAPELGNALQLKFMPLGTMVHNVEILM